MRFFEHQEKARAETRQLLLLFAATVAALVQYITKDSKGRAVPEALRTGYSLWPVRCGALN